MEAFNIMQTNGKVWTRDRIMTVLYAVPGEFTYWPNPADRQYRPRYKVLLNPEGGVVFEEHPPVRGQEPPSAQGGGPDRLGEILAEMRGPIMDPTAGLTVNNMDDTVMIGKYKGLTWRHVFTTNWSYAEWIIHEVSTKGPKCHPELQKGAFLARLLFQEPQRRSVQQEGGAAASSRSQGSR